ncbi:hypothetical protein ACS0TY_027312 [Phlomoides rotata]
MEEIKAAQAIIMRKLKVYDMEKEEDKGEESDEKDENDESEDNAEKADEADEEIGEEDRDQEMGKKVGQCMGQGDRDEQGDEGVEEKGEDEQEAEGKGEDSDEGDEEHGEDNDEGDEEDEEKDDEHAEKRDEERDDGHNVGKKVGQEEMCDMIDTPMFPGLLYDPLDDQILTGAEEEFQNWVVENQESGMRVTLSIENMPQANTHWFDSIWDDEGWLVSEGKMTNVVYGNWKKADKKKDGTWLDEENVVIDYILGRLLLHGTGLPWVSVDKVFGVGHVKNNHWILYEM